MDGFCESLRFGKIRYRCLTPEKIRIGRISEAPRDGLIEPRAGLVKALLRAFAGQEARVVLVDVRSHHVSRVRIGSRHEERGYVTHIRGKARGNKLLNSFGGGDEHFAAHVATLLDRGELIFEVHAGCTCGNHGLHEFEGIERTAKTGLRIGHYGHKEVRSVVNAAAPLDFIRSSEGIVDAIHQGWHRIDRIERLIRVHGLRGVVVRGYLPTGHIDRLDAGLHLLHGLATSKGTQGVDKIVFLE